MSRINLVPVVTLTMFVAVTLCSYAQEKSLQKSDTTMSKEKSPKVVYSCPMHPEVTSDNPGMCPKCGMKLEKKETVVLDSSKSSKNKVKKSNSTKAAYYCAMHPSETSAKPGKCPVCGMDFAKKKPSNGEGKKNN